MKHFFKKKQNRMRSKSHEPAPVKKSHNFSHLMMADDKKSKRQRRRKHAIDELLSTEKTYVDLMSQLVVHYVTGLRNKTSIISSEDHCVLFPADIHAILGLNTVFYEDLVKAVNNGSFDINTTKIGNILYTFCPHFVCSVLPYPL